MKSKIGNTKSKIGKMKSKIGNIKSEIGKMKSKIGKEKSKLNFIKAYTLEYELYKCTLSICCTQSWLQYIINYQFCTVMFVHVCNTITLQLHYTSTSHLINHF